MDEFCEPQSGTSGSRFELKPMKGKANGIYSMVLTQQNIISKLKENLKLKELARRWHKKLKINSTGSAMFRKAMAFSSRESIVYEMQKHPTASVSMYI